MKTLLLAGCALASAIALSGCGTTGAGGTSFTDLAKQIASDPRCSHTDRVQGNLGGLSGNNLAVFLERTCPAAAAPATSAAAAP